MNKAKTKYPVILYVFLLLIVASLFTGVTFSRYAQSSSGGGMVEVSPFNCSFTVDHISSTAFNNLDFDASINAPRSLGFTLRNFKEGGAPSDVDIKSTFRIRAPKELLENIAFQITDGQDTALTPQYELKKILNAADGETISTEGTDYGKRGDLNENISVTRLSGTSVRASGAYATISAYIESKQSVYSVSFVRGKQIIYENGLVGNDMSAPIYYVNCSDSIEFITLDIYIDSSLATMKLPGKVKTERDFKFYFTTIKRYGGEEGVYSDYGMTYADFVANNSGKIVSMRFNAQNVKCFEDSSLSGTYQTETLQVTKTGEGTSSTAEFKFVNGEELIDVIVNGTVGRFVHNGKTLYFDTAKVANETYNHKDGEANYTIGVSTGKQFQFYVNVLFVQNSIIP